MTQCGIWLNIESGDGLLYMYMFNDSKPDPDDGPDLTLNL